MAATGFKSEVLDSSYEVFEVCRISELDAEGIQSISSNVNGSVPSDLIKTNDGFMLKEKAHQRDSGFDTMTKYETNNNAAVVNGNVKTQLKDVEDGSFKAPLKHFLPVHQQQQFRLGLFKKIDPTQQLKEDMEKRATELAQRLFNSKGKDKREVIQHLSQKDDFGVLVAKKYMQMFNFSNVALDEGLRMLLKHLALIGETQERERVLHQFASRFQQCNPRFLSADTDTIHVLVCATALLNTDLHGPKAGNRRKMTCKQFVSNLEGVGPEGKNIPQNLLKSIYRSIKKKPLPWCEAPLASHATSPTKSTSIVPKPRKAPQSSVVFRSQSMNHQNIHQIRPLPIHHEDMDGVRVGAGRSSKSKTLPRKQGVLWRKPIIESDGSRTVKRKRRWKLMVVALNGIELHAAKKDSTDTFTISLHHSLAEAEDMNGSTKRNNVFRLTLANTSVYLFQTSSKEEQKAWVRAVNRNAALLSAAPLSAGIGSQKKFQRPLLPSTCSTLPLNQQLSDQQDRLDALCAELDELQQIPSRDGATVSEKQYYKDKEAYLRHEVYKYEVYTNSLSELQACNRRNQSTSPNHVVECSPPDTHSLLSVSPSEPGTTAFANSGGSPSGSTGDLLRSDDVKRPQHQGLGASHLTPTASLPNLHPQNFRRFPAWTSTPRSDSSSSASALSPAASDNSNYSLVPSVSEAVDGHASVKLVRRQMSPESYSSNNNCNRTFGFNLTSRDREHLKLALSNGHTKFSVSRQSEKDQATLEKSPTCNSCELMKVKRHRADVVQKISKTPGVSTTDPVNRLLIPEDLLAESFDNGVIQPAQLPRVKGRRERRGASRHSYLQAVHNLSQT